jgi:hypothetical protein
VRDAPFSDSLKRRMPRRAGADRRQRDEPCESGSQTSNAPVKRTVARRCTLPVATSTVVTYRSALGRPPMYALHRWSGDHVLALAKRSGRSIDVRGVPSARLSRSWHAEGEQRIDEIIVPSGDQVASVIGSTESSSN